MLIYVHRHLRVEMPPRKMSMSIDVSNGLQIS